MGEPSGHWKSLAKSFILLSEPSTRNSEGECTPVVIRILRDSEMKNKLFILHKQRQMKLFLCFNSLTFSVFGTPGLAGSYPEHLLWCIVQARQFGLGTVLLHPALIGDVRLFDAAIVSNVLTLRIDAVQLEERNNNPVRKEV